MTKTSTVVWSLIGTVVAVLGILGLIYGPGMYRQGKALVGPIVDIAQSEERLTALNDEIVELDLARFSELHDIIRGNNNVKIEIHGDGANE